MGLTVGAFLEIGMICEEGTPAKDQDILEMITKYQSKWYLDKNWNDNFRLNSGSYDTPNINKSQLSILFPYYITGVGVVPVWYKSTKVLNQLFKEQIENSKYKVTKRSKLGL